MLNCVRPGKSWLLLVALPLLLVCLRTLPRPDLRDAAPSSTAIHARGGELLRLSLAGDEQYRLWTPLSDIDPRLIEAVLLYEDRWFRWHPGINPVALFRALRSTVFGATRQGASTLTMQLARRLYGLRTHRPLGKIHQMAAAIWLELRYSKRELLEAYLNLAPYGGNIEGVAAASLIYFHKQPQHLSLPEILSLAVIPQNPAKRGRSQQGPAQTNHREPAYRRLLDRWLQAHPEQLHYRTELEAAPSLARVGEMPFLAAHVTDQLLRTRHAGAILSSIDLPQQALLDRIIKQFVKNRASAGVDNAVAMLVERDSGKVRALVGSADYFDRRIDGQVNGALAKRSPGSTLKPFIYGLALDQGLIHPLTLLKDAPSHFGAFSPENFDGHFIGPVSAEQALIRSRNVPAVALAARLTSPSLYTFLRRSAVSRMASENHYGLSLALGGGEVTMEELARLYVMLGNEGRLIALRYVEQEVSPSAAPAATAMLSPEAAFITVQMLQTNPRPDTGQPASPPVAWKTGTSWGFRDAWSVGLVGRFVLLVWVGRFDGGSNAAFVGVRSAAPLFFRIVDALRLQTAEASGAIAAIAPPSVTRIDVCRASGDLPNAFCPETSPTWFIPGKSPIKVSSLHRALRIDQRNDQPTCMDTPYTRLQVFEYWSDDLQKLFRDAGLPRREPPVEPACGPVGNSPESDRPLIASPQPGVVYSLRLSRDDSIALRATTVATRQSLFWFANEGLIAKASSAASVNWRPVHPGRYQLRVIDEQGRADVREVEVEFLP